jgi:hypothetical protein
MPGLYHMFDLTIVFFFLNKILFNKDTLISLHIICCCFHVTVAELSHGI